MLQKIIVLSLLLSAIVLNVAYATNLKAKAYQTVTVRELTLREKSLVFLINNNLSVEDVRKFDAVISAESSWNPNAHNATTNDSCLIQANILWEDTANELGLDYKNNVEDCLKLGIHIQKVQGWSAWSASSNRSKVY